MQQNHVHKFPQHLASSHWTRASLPGLVTFAANLETEWPFGLEVWNDNLIGCKSLRRTTLKEVIMNNIIVYLINKEYTQETLFTRKLVNNKSVGNGIFLEKVTPIHAVWSNWDRSNGIWDDVFLICLYTFNCFLALEKTRKITQIKEDVVF